MPSQSPENKFRQYRDGELDLILSLVPTRENVTRLAGSLGRSPGAIEIVFRLAYTDFGHLGQGAEIQRKKVAEAKARAGILIGPQRVRRR